MAGGDGHVGDGEKLVQLVKGGRAAAPAGAHHAGPNLHGLFKLGAVEQPVQHGDEGGVGGGIVHGACHHQAVGLFKLGGQLVDHVVKDTPARLGAPVTGDAAPHGQMAHLDDFGLHPLGLKHPDHLVQGDGGVPVGPGTAV